MVEPLGSYEPIGRYEPKLDTESSVRILWSRLGVFGGALLIVFLLGRASAPTGVSQSEMDVLKQELVAANAQIDRLQQAPLEPEQPIPSPSPSVISTKAQEYVIAPGDTLGSIAAKFYGDATLAYLIARENGITDASRLKVGTKIVIPPKSKASATPSPNATR